MEIQTEKETLEVGDKIRVKNWANDYVAEVIRVTKTKAVAKTPYNNTLEFKRNCKGGHIRKKTQEKWSTTTYTLLTNEGTN